MTNLKIVAVAMQDVAEFGVDRFYVLRGPDEVLVYDVFKDGRVVQVSPEAMPERMVTSAIEKFNACYRVVPPVEVTNLDELTKHLGGFEIVDATHVTKRAP